MVEPCSPLARRALQDLMGAASCGEKDCCRRAGDAQEALPSEYKPETGEDTEDEDGSPDGAKKKKQRDINKLKDSFAPLAAKVDGGKVNAAVPIKERIKKSSDEPDSDEDAADKKNHRSSIAALKA